MKRYVPFLIVAVALTAHARLHGQGPFDPEDWPDPADPDAVVHFVSTDDAFVPLGDTWTPDLTILSGGDQVTEDHNIGGFTGKKVIGNYLNIADTAYEEWGEHETIDILVQFYGDSAALGADGNQRNFNFLTGTLPQSNLNAPVGGSIPLECKNREWNWFLFRIPNDIRPDGNRFVGPIAADAQGATGAGGVNNGTIRFQGVPGFIVRVVAFGELGAFGEPEEINVCLEALPCSDVPETNLVWVDVNSDTSDHLEILNDGDQTVRFEDNVGPPGDKRRAARPTGTYMNFGITDNYLGEPCNEPQAVKICVEFYDDPGLIGAAFGPEAYATDDQGGIAFFDPQKQHILEGTDTWIRRSWVVPDVSLEGVNTAPLTGGPRLSFLGGDPSFSYVAIGILRSGDHPLAGQDPLADCYQDPFICTDAYGNYAELDLGEDLEEGLTVGTSGGDQEMIVAEAGPPDDRRMAVRAAHSDGSPQFRHDYINFALVGEPFGPSSQPNAHLAICVTYYDDPELIGATLRPEVYKSDVGGVVTFAFTNPNIAVALEGTDTWRDAYWEIPDMNFSGVNQGPQAAARFQTSDEGKIFITRVRYAVIRPCGPNAGVNLLEECNPLCSGEWGNYAEMDLGADPDIEDGLAPGDSAGDQEMIIDVAGPADDLREAIRPAHDDGINPDFPHIYLNFALVGEPFGPTSQPNAHLAICVTYYDDPELVGHTFRPEVYRSDVGGTEDFKFTDPAIAVALEGTDTWRDAYFEIPDVKFSGVNQGPQAAARFATSEGGKIFFTRVRYAVIRSCGPDAGDNPLEDCQTGAEIEVRFKRGDPNADDNVDITDAVAILEFLFSGGGTPSCMSGADVNDDGGVDITDAVAILGYLFSGDGPPDEPFAECGLDPTEDDLTCESYPPCA